MEKLEALQAELDTSVATIKDQEAVISGLKRELKASAEETVKIDFVKEVLAMGAEYNANSETLVEMLEAKEIMKAENIALKAFHAEGTTVEAGEEKKQEKKQESVMTKEEIERAVNGDY